jgi:hypothetical protein
MRPVVWIKQIGVIVACGILLSCENNAAKSGKTEPTKISTGVRAFAVYRIISRTEAEPYKFVGTTFIFEKDSLFIASKSFGGTIKVTRILPDQKEIDSVNYYLKKINFYSCILNDCGDLFKDGLYCGPNIGFIDSIGKSQACNSSRVFEITRPFLGYLNRLGGTTVTGRDNMIRYSTLIKNRQLKVCPPPIELDTVKFIPPVIKE